MILTSVLLSLCAQDVLDVSAQPRALSKQVLEVGVYDVTDLTGSRERALVLEGLRPSPNPADVQEAIAKLDRHETLSEQVAQRQEGLLEAVRTFAQPPLGGDDHRLAIVGDGQLVMVGTAKQQQWLQGFLSGVASFEGLIEVETRVLELDLGTLELLGVEQTSTTIDAAARADLEARLENHEHDMVIAPTVATLPFARAVLFTGKEVAYIENYELRVLDGASVADPVISVVTDGVTIELRSVPLSDGRLAIAIELDLAKLIEPIPQFETSLGSGHKVTIQLPEVRKVHASSRVYLRETDSALFSTVDPAGEREYLILYSARSLPTGEQQAEERR